MDNTIGRKCFKSQRRGDKGDWRRFYRTFRENRTVKKARDKWNAENYIDLAEFRKPAHLARSYSGMRWRDVDYVERTE